VAVETLGKRAETTDHCYGGWDRFERLVLRLYVQHADLIPVTHRAVAIDFDSGVQVNLASGVVVLPLGSGLSGGPSHQVEVDGFSFAASLPPPVVSTTYVPGAHFDLSQPLATVEGGPVILGPRALLQTDLRRRLDVFGHVGHEPTRRYVLRTACAEYLVPARQVRTRPWEGWLEVQRRPHPLPPAYQVPGDVAVYWLDGALAGKTADVISWPRAPVVQGGRSCFRHRVGFHVDRSQEAFTLCFENDDVTSVRRGGI
jgi:hypothetical protein